MQDLTFESFAYLRAPLLLACVAFLTGAVGTFRWVGLRAFLAASLMMVVFFHAARLALVVFDPFLSSRPLAEAILRSPEGKLIVDHHYYTFSSVFFYLNRDALLLNGKFLNLEYGAAAPGAPDIFLTDAQFAELWRGPNRYYIVADHTAFARLEKLVGHEQLNTVMLSGGKAVFTNQPFTGTFLLPQTQASGEKQSTGQETSLLNSKNTLALTLPYGYKILSPVHAAEFRFEPVSVGTHQIIAADFNFRC